MIRYRKIYKRIKNDIAVLAIRAVVAFFRILPRKNALTVGSILGRIVPYVDRKDFHLAVKHLTVAFGDEKTAREIRSLAHESFRYLAMNFVDAARLGSLSHDDALAVCVPHNIERLKENMAKGNGVIGLSSHSGCWELLGPYLTAIGIPTACIARRLFDPRVEKMLLDSRTRYGIINITRGHDTREIIRMLKNGNFLGVLIDQDTKVKGVFVDFFGKPTHTASAPAVLSLKYNAPIIPVLTYRDNEHRHHVCIGKPLEINATGDTDADVIELTARCSEVTEQFIREHPEQWVWFHRRWKTKMNDN